MVPVQSKAVSVVAEQLLPHGPVEVSRVPVLVVANFGGDTVRATSWVDLGRFLGFPSVEPKKICFDARQGSGVNAQYGGAVDAQQGSSLPNVQQAIGGSNVQGQHNGRSEDVGNGQKQVETENWVPSVALVVNPAINSSTVGRWADVVDDGDEFEVDEGELVWFTLVDRGAGSVLDVTAISGIRWGFTKVGKRPTGRSADRGKIASQISPVNLEDVASAVARNQRLVFVFFVDPAD
ncbi:hypothetical protein NE237_021099 [Protea cynaroides]|uniref:Uncharacterized protein n=1 Tax=Protea cynaroides TaxID=273540 RepID=A0A9Q0K2A4_9MAGN|nr:hypothetical protein NE237_021099 [Protea cynaroides]